MPLKKLLTPAPGQEAVNDVDSQTITPSPIDCLTAGLQRGRDLAWRVHRGEDRISRKIVRRQGNRRHWERGVIGQPPVDVAGNYRE
jgi:hypothetical protein